MTNSELATLFGELADIMELAGEGFFKIRAYRNAAEIIKNYRELVESIPPDKLIAVPGIGKAITEKVQIAGTSGTFPTLEKWRQNDYATLLPLCRLPGITPKMVRALIKELNIKTMDDIRSATADGRLNSYEKLDAESKRVIYEYTKSNCA